MGSITGLLLAAGSSRRFGADKLLQTLPDGEQVAVRACRSLLAGVDQVLAVVRPGSDNLMACLQAEGAQVQIFADAEQGMGSSLAFATQTCPAADGWLIALADMPWIEPATIHRLADMLRMGAGIVAPRYQNQRGHPVGFAQRFAPELATLSGDIGAKIIIQAHLEQLQFLDCDDPGVLRDIDQPADLNNFVW